MSPFRFTQLPLPHSFWLCLVLRHPSLRTATWYRAKTGIQLDSAEILEILKVLRTRKSCRLLVFGLGRDSLLWHSANKNGHTDFLEDNNEWITIWKRSNREINCHQIQYTSKLEDSSSTLKHGMVSLPSLPRDIEGRTYDVVIVDAPAGCGVASQPGRTQSILLAKTLASLDADVFVHDCDREVEKLACDIILKDSALINEVNRLRHYKVNASTERSNSFR